MNWLLTAALSRNLQALQFQIINSNPEALCKALDERVDFEDFTNCNAIHLIARLFDGDGFLELIKHIQRETLNEYILKSNDWQMNGLQCALVFQRYEEGVLELIDKIDTNVLNTALVKQDSFGFNGFMAAIEYQQMPVLLKLFHEDTKEACLQSLLTRSKEGVTLFGLLLQKAPEEIIKKVLAWMDDDLLDQMMRIENSDLWHGLHLAAFYQTDEILYLLAKRLSGELLSELVMQNTLSNGLNYLHFLFGKASSATVFAYLEKITDNALQVALQKLDSQRQTPYIIALQVQNEEVVTFITKILNNHQLNRIFSILTQDNVQCLTTLLHFYSESLLLDILNRLDSSTLEKALKSHDNNNFTVLNSCALRFPSYMLTRLLEEADQETINREINIQIKTDDHLGPNLLNLVANGHKGYILSQIVAKASKEALESALLTTNLKDENRNTPIHQVFSLNEYGPINQVLEKVSSSFLNHAMLVPNRYNWLPINNAVSFASPQIIFNLIDHLTESTIDAALLNSITHQDLRGTNLLHQLILNQPLNVIKAVCDKASQDVLDQSFLQKLMYAHHVGFNALMLIVYSRDNEVLAYFLQRISPRVMTDALLVQEQNRCFPLHYAARNLRAESVLGLCQFLDDEQYNRIIAEPGDLLGIHNFTPIHAVLTSQFPEVGHQLLMRMNQQSIEKAMATKPSIGNSPLSSIISLYDYPTIKWVLDQITNETLKMALKDSHLHYYQMLINNTQLTNETAELILEELKLRGGY